MIEYVSDTEMTHLISMLNILLEKKSDLTVAEVEELDILSAWNCSFIRKQANIIRKMNKKYILDGVECG